MTDLFLILVGTIALGWVGIMFAGWYAKWRDHVELERRIRLKDEQSRIAGDRADNPGDLADRLRRGEGL